jgi:hypothetical protein
MIHVEKRMVCPNCRNNTIKIIWDGLLNEASNVVYSCLRCNFTSKNKEDFGIEVKDEVDATARVKYGEGAVKWAKHGSCHDKIEFISGGHVIHRLNENADVEETDFENDLIEEKLDALESLLANLIDSIIEEEDYFSLKMQAVAMQYVLNSDSVDAVRVMSDYVNSMLYR